MKKAILIVCFLLASLHITSQIKGGLHVGSGLFSVKSDVLEYIDSPLTIDFGTEVVYLYTDNFEIINDLSFSFRKATFKAYDDRWFENPTEVTLNYNSIDYNLLGSYYLLKPYVAVQAGLSASFLVGSNDTQKHIYGFGNVGDMPDTSYGAAVGLSLGLENIKLNLRYSMSLNNPYSDFFYRDNDFQEIDINGKHHYFSFSMVYFYSEI